MKALVKSCVLFFCLAATANEWEIRFDITDRAQHLFESENFIELNKIYNHYLISEERTQSGLWKLAVFFDALSKYSKVVTTSEDFWVARFAKASRLIENSPDSALGYLVYADILLSHAYAKKKGCYCEKKRRKNEEFEQRIEKAKLYLLSKKTSLMTNPQWYVLMLIMAREQGWNHWDFQQLFDKATLAFPYYHKIYLEAVTYLKPQWHGKEGDVEAFARKAITITHEKDKSSIYARIYWYILSVNQINEPLASFSQVDWSTMKLAIENILEDYPDLWNLNHFARFSCMAGDPTMTHKLIDMMHEHMILAVWRDENFFLQCQQWSNDLSGVILTN